MKEILKDFLVLLLTISVLACYYGGSLIAGFGLFNSNLMLMVKGMVLVVVGEALYKILKIFFIKGGE